MMENNIIVTAAKAQLALDLGCDSALFDTPGNEIVPWQDLPGRRRRNDQQPVLEIAIWGDKLVAACDKSILAACREYLQNLPARWLFTPKPFRGLDDILGYVGAKIGMIHHYYLPDLSAPAAKAMTGLRWYEENELGLFRDRREWDDALAFNPAAPDVLAVAAMDPSGQPMAVAGASHDGRLLWQLGVSVLPQHRGKGLASGLTALLKEEVMRRGAVPFYGTTESHIISMNVAHAAGFKPAFAYLYAQRKGT